MSIEFDTPANRIIASQAPKNQFRVDTSLSDLALLRQLSVQGRLIYEIGTSTGSGTVISIVPNSGETIFVYKLFGVSDGNRTFVNKLINDGNTRIQFITFLSLASQSIEIIDSLVGNGVKALTVTTSASGTTGTLTMTLLGWIENTSRIRDPAT